MSNILSKQKSFLGLDISDSSFFEKFTTKTIEDIFIKIGKLEKDSFNISKEYFSDGFYKINFYYPTDMNNESAIDFFESLLIKTKDMTLEEFTLILDK